MRTSERERGGKGEGEGKREGEYGVSEASIHPGTNDAHCREPARDGLDKSWHSHRSLTLSQHVINHKAHRRSRRSLINVSVCGGHIDDSRY